MAKTEQATLWQPAKISTMPIVQEEEDEEIPLEGDTPKKRSSNNNLNIYDDDDMPYPDKLTNDVSIGAFFQSVMNNGASDNVLCFKMIVFLILIMSALIIGNAASIFTTEELNADYVHEVSCHTIYSMPTPDMYTALHYSTMVCVSKSAILILLLPFCFASLLCFQFDSYATDVVILARDRVSVLFDFTISLRDHVIGQCIETQNCDWPFVTLSAFEERHYRFVEQSKVNEVALIPLVKHEDRREWELYSVAQQGWVQHGIDFQNGGENNGTTVAAPITPYLHNGFGGPAPSRPVYAAIRQIAPAPLNPTRVNFDAFSDDTFRSAFLWMEETRHPLLSDVLRFNPTVKGAEPQALFLEPMGETFEPDSKLVGIFSTLITWSTFFRTSIPPSRGEIILVLEDTCNSGTLYSYAIFGRSVSFLGVGDFHDVNYDGLSVSGELPTTARYFNEDNDDEYETPCGYTMALYPTEDFRKSFDSNDPLIYTSLVLIIMVSTILVFCLYDHCGTLLLLLLLCVTQ
jgi:hypothetical protein